MREEPTPRAVASGPGLITVVTCGKDGGVYATHTDPTRPTGWLDAPVRVSGDTTDVWYAEAAATPGFVVVVWRDNGTGTLMAAFQDARGAWGPPQPATPAGATSLGSNLTVTCPSPGAVLAVWTMNDRTLHCGTYDSHAAHPVWSAPAQIAEFPGNDFASSIHAMGTGDGKADVVWQGVFGSMWNIHYDGGWSAPAEITPQRLTHWGVPYTIVPAVTGDRRANWFWQGRDNRVQTIYRDPQQPQWSAPLRLGQPWWSYSEVAAVSVAEGSVSLYRVDFGSEIGEVPELLTCFYDPATPTALPGSRMREPWWRGPKPCGTCRARRATRPTPGRPTRSRSPARSWPWTPATVRCSPNGWCSRRVRI
ncbi:hypothetical protein ACFQ10_10810 [Streptomyces indonesiensis]